MKNNVKNSTYLLLWAAMFLLNTAAFGQSSSDIFLQIKGAKQGQIKGSVAEKGNEGAIKIVTCQNSNLSPRDAASGQATGKRQHKPITITKEWDKSSPMLMTAFSTKENLPEVTLTFYKTGKSGATKWYTITLSDVLISGLKSSAGGKGQTPEEVTFTFQKIEWTYHDGGVTASDDWHESKN
jgi:type VI secretion system secreted protein Hcp